MSESMDNIRRADEGNDPLVHGELLLSRLVDGEASERDWEEFRSLAGRGAGGLWRALAEAQRDQAVLGVAVGECVQRGERVGLPGQRVTRGAEGVIGRILPWAGWAAAACVALTWGAGLVAPRSTRGAFEPITGVNPGSIRLVSADDAKNEWIRRGKEEGVVVGEVPQRIVLSATPAPDGNGSDVTMLVQVVERRRVTGEYRIGHKEDGSPVLMPASMPARSAGSLY
jgi:hypothetical protein